MKFSFLLNERALWYNHNYFARAHIIKKKKTCMIDSCGYSMYRTHGHIGDRGRRKRPREENRAPARVVRLQRNKLPFLDVARCCRWRWTSCGYSVAKWESVPFIFVFSTFLFSPTIDIIILYSFTNISTIIHGSICERYMKFLTLFLH